MRIWCSWSISNVRNKHNIDNTDKMGWVPQRSGGDPPDVRKADRMNYPTIVVDYGIKGVFVVHHVIEIYADGNRLTITFGHDGHHVACFQQPRVRSITRVTGEM